MKLREGKMVKGGLNDSPRTTRPEGNPPAQGTKINMKIFICFYNQEYIINYCVKIKALDYDDAEDKFRKYLIGNEVGYINENKLYIEDMEKIYYAD